MAALLEGVLPERAVQEAAGKQITCTCMSQRGLASGRGLWGQAGDVGAGQGGGGGGGGGMEI